VIVSPLLAKRPREMGHGVDIFWLRIKTNLVPETWGTRLSLQCEPHRDFEKTIRISVRSSGRHALPAARGYNRPQAPHL
jgi:hypothetical protein